MVAVRAVHLGRLVKLGTDARHRRVEQRADQVRVRQEIIGFPAAHADNHVDESLRGKQRRHQAADDDPRKEIRKGVNRLQHLLVAVRPQLIQKHRQNDGPRKSGYNIPEAHAEGIEKRPPECVLPEHRHKVLVDRVGPRAAEDARADLEILKGQRQAVHGHVAEQNQIRNARQQEKVDPFMLFDLLPQRFFGCFRRCHTLTFPLEVLFRPLVLSL